MSKSKGLVSFDSAVDNPGFQNLLDVSPEEVWQKREQVHLIDVRMPSEFTGELGHIPGAKLVVLDTIPEEIKNLPQDETIVFVCRSGGRSAQASAFALDRGYKNVFNMKGGMMLWNMLGLKVERD